MEDIVACEEINKIFSEHNLIKMRVKVEIEWFIFLSNQKKALNLYQSSQNLRLGSSGAYIKISVQKTQLVLKKSKILQSMM